LRRLQSHAASAQRLHGTQRVSLRTSAGRAAGASALRFFFMESGLGPLGTLRLNCTFVHTRVAAPASSASAARSCAGTAPCVS
jgi:hypothetical protein